MVSDYFLDLVVVGGGRMKVCVINFQMITAKSQFGGGNLF